MKCLTWLLRSMMQLYKHTATGARQAWNGILLVGLVILHTAVERVLVRRLTVETVPSAIHESLIIVSLVAAFLLDVVTSATNRTSDHTHLHPSLMSGGGQRWNSVETVNQSGQWSTACLGVKLLFKRFWLLATANCLLLLITIATPAVHWPAD